MLTSWRTFLRVIELGSISAAAVELGYTQSAVSRQVAALERQVGLPLLVRLPRGVATTAAGEAFARHARVVVGEADRAVRAARAARENEPVPLLIGATPALAASVVPVALRRLGEVSWTLVPGLTAQLRPMVQAGELDLALVTDAPPGLPDEPGLVRRSLGTDAMRALVPVGHRLAEAEQIRLGELAHERWVEDNEGSAVLLRTHAARAGFEARIELDAADLVGKIALVAAGHAVALVPGVLAGSLRPDVVALRLVDGPRRGIFAIRPAGVDQADVVRDLEAYVAEALAAL